MGEPIKEKKKKKSKDKTLGDIQVQLVFSRIVEFFWTVLWSQIRISMLLDLAYPDP